jgi:hypothetical protein
VLHSSWIATGEAKSCTMIVTEPNDVAAEIHDRMRGHRQKAAVDPKRPEYADACPIQQNSAMLGDVICPGE